MRSDRLVERRRFLGSAAALGGYALLSGCAPGAVAPALRPERRQWGALRSLAERYVAERKVAGMVIGVSVGGGAPIFIARGTLGFDRQAAVDAQTIWRIYSMTKPVTGVLAAMLIDEGKLGLDQPIADFLPAFGRMQVAANPAAGLDGTPAKTAITVRHLLTHTAGLTYHYQPDSAVAKAYRARGLMPGLRVLGREEGDGAAPASLQAFAEAVAQLPLIAEPGTAWHYSISLDVLGAVIERAAGVSFEKLLQTRIFDPLEMIDTGFAVPAADFPRFATNYFLNAGRLLPIDVPPRTEYAGPASYPAGGGGLVSTADDYLRFIAAVGAGGVHGGRQFMSPRAAKLAVSNLLPDGVSYEENQGFGAGGRVVLSAGPSQFPGSFGWGGAAGTLASTLPSRQLSVVLMTQYMPQQAYPLPAELGAAIASDLSG